MYCQYSLMHLFESSKIAFTESAQRYDIGNNCPQEQDRKSRNNSHACAEKIFKDCPGIAHHCTYIQMQQYEDPSKINRIKRCDRNHRFFNRIFSKLKQQEKDQAVEKQCKK